MSFTGKQFVAAGVVCCGMLLASVAPASAQSIANAGFETPILSAGSFQYNPTGAGVGWTFGGSTGISANGSAFTAGNPNAPEGSQVALLQGTGTFSQLISFVADGTYSVSFLAAQRGTGSFRGGSSPDQQQFSVSLGGTTIGSITPVGASYQLFTTAGLFLKAGTYNLAFTGLNPLGTDNTALIDSVRIAGVTTAAPEPGSAALLSFLALGGVGRFLIRRRAS